MLRPPHGFGAYGMARARRGRKTIMTTDPGTEPDPREALPDLEDLEEEAGIDPTPQQVQEYEELIEERSPGSPPPSPEPPD
jgi:hypothetical protein